MSNPYSNGMTTTHSNFNVEDISHKPKRMQSAILKEILVERGEVITELGPVISNIPSTLTLESMISYYEKNATGEVTNLYKATAKWLTTCLKTPRVKAKEEAYDNETQEDTTMEENRVVADANM